MGKQLNKKTAEMVFRSMKDSGTMLGLGIGHPIIMAPSNYNGINSLIVKCQGTASQEIQATYAHCGRYPMPIVCTCGTIFFPYIVKTYSNVFWQWPEKTI